MRKLLLSTMLLAGLSLGAAGPASAAAATGLAVKPAGTESGSADKVHFRHHGFGGLGFGFGWGYPRYYGYSYAPRYRNYDDYGYDRPRYSYYSYNSGHRNRHYCERHHRWEY